VHRRITIADDPAGRKRLSQDCDFVSANCRVGGSGILFKVRESLCTKYRNHVDRLCRQPCKRQLRWATALLPSKLDRLVLLSTQRRVVGTWALQEGFRRHLGMSPMAYLHQMQLRMLTTSCSGQTRISGHSGIGREEVWVQQSSPFRDCPH